LNQEFFNDPPYPVRKVNGEWESPALYLEIWPNFEESIYSWIPTPEMSQIEYESSWTVQERLSGQKTAILRLQSSGVGWPNYNNLFNGSQGHITYPTYISMRFKNIFSPASTYEKILWNGMYESEYRNYHLWSYLSDTLGVAFLYMIIPLCWLIFSGKVLVRRRAYRALNHQRRSMSPPNFQERSQSPDEIVAMPFVSQTDERDSRSVHNIRLAHSLRAQSCPDTIQIVDQGARCHQREVTIRTRLIRSRSRGARLLRTNDDPSTPPPSLSPSLD